MQDLDREEFISGAQPVTEIDGVVSVIYTLLPWAYSLGYGCPTIYIQFIELVSCDI